MSSCQVSSILITVTFAGGLGMLVLGVIALVRIILAANSGRFETRTTG